MLYDVGVQRLIGNARLLLPQFPKGLTRCLYYYYNVYYFTKSYFRVFDADDESEALLEYRGSESSAADAHCYV